MPCVDGKIAGINLTEELKRELEGEITRVLQKTIGAQLPREVGYQEGTDEFKRAHEFAKRIMPGWTWITLSEASWAVRGQPITDGVAAQFTVLVLAGALTQEHRQAVVANIATALTRILGGDGRPVHLFVDIVEGEVDMTLPEDLFGGLLNGQTHKLIRPDDVEEFFREGISK